MKATFRVGSTVVELEYTEKGQITATPLDSEESWFVTLEQVREEYVPISSKAKRFADYAEERI